MIFKCLKFVLFGLILATSWQASSSIIPYNGYELNGNVVSKGNLEWLQWSETKEVSISSALASYSQYGWELASNAQVNNLFEAFGFSAAPDENVGVDTFRSSTELDDDEPYDKFLAIFGVTYTRDHSRGNGSADDPNTGTTAIYGSDGDNDGYYNVATVTSDYNSPFGFADPFISLSEDRTNVTADDGYPDHGIALVRTVEVGEPSAFVIIALGIMGLATRRFKKQS